MRPPCGTPGRAAIGPPDRAAAGAGGVDSGNQSRSRLRPENLSLDLTVFHARRGLATSTRLIRPDLVSGVHGPPRDEGADPVGVDGRDGVINRHAEVGPSVDREGGTFKLDRLQDRMPSAYVGDGANRWPAAHVSDVAHLYRLAIERGEPGARYHAVAEEGIPARAIAEAIGRGLGVPAVSLSTDAAAGHFGWLAGFVGMDMAASSALTRARTGWDPTGPGLIADLDAMRRAAA